MCILIYAQCTAPELFKIEICTCGNALILENNLPQSWLHACYTYVHVAVLTILELVA